LQRLRPNGKPVFEILTVRSRKGGFEIGFSSPPGPSALEPARYQAKQWWYEPTDAYGGPQKDVVAVPVKSARVSADGLRIFLEMDGLLPQQVAHVRLPDVQSKDGMKIWTSDFWYTMNAMSDEEFRP
jgi:cytochrome c